MTSFFFHPIFIFALIAGTTASLIGGLVGPFVVVRRISFLAGSIAHAILAGIGLFLYLERAHGLPMPPPMIGALLTAIGSALLIARAEKKFHVREDSFIATIWALGMAIGIVFLSKTPGYTAELSNILIGNILWVSSKEIFLLLALALVSICFIALRFQQIKLMLFDPEQAQLQGISTSRLYEQLLILVAISVVALVQVVGIILVMTFLTLPSLLAGLFFQRLSSLIIAAIGISIACTATGLVSAYALDWPAGACITICAGILYILGKIGKSGIRTHGTRKGTRP